MMIHECEDGGSDASMSEGEPRDRVSAPEYSPNTGAHRAPTPDPSRNTGADCAPTPDPSPNNGGGEHGNQLCGGKLRAWGR